MFGRPQSIVDGFHPAATHVPELFLVLTLLGCGSTSNDSGPTTSNSGGRGGNSSQSAVSGGMQPGGSGHAGATQSQRATASGGNSTAAGERTSAISTAGVTAVHSNSIGGSLDTGTNSGGRTNAKGGSGGSDKSQPAAGAYPAGGTDGSSNSSAGHVGFCTTNANAGAPPSCRGLASTCGPNGNADCCESRLVPAGQFNRNNDVRYPATVSDFRLDTYEVTAARFREFTTCYPTNRPTQGSGKNPNNPDDLGWDEAWNAYLPKDAAELESRLACGQRKTFENTEGRLPINCLDWYLAFAFCDWDGGRLPTEAEWNYAAAGGGDQRVYPWSTPPTDATVDNNHAVLTFPLLPVGSKSPVGDGRWGHADLAGSVGEWVVDFGYSLLAYPVPCVDCAHLVSEGNGRGHRGGGASLAASNNRTDAVSSLQPDTRMTYLGVRCARAP